MMALMALRCDDGPASHLAMTDTCIFTIRRVEEATRVYAGRFIHVFDEFDTGEQKRKNRFVVALLPRWFDDLTNFVSVL
jgi:hypothetical protein